MTDSNSVLYVSPTRRLKCVHSLSGLFRIIEFLKLMPFPTLSNTHTGITASQTQVRVVHCVNHLATAAAKRINICLSGLFASKWPKWSVVLMNE